MRARMGSIHPRVASPMVGVADAYLIRVSCILLLCFSVVVVVVVVVFAFCALVRVILRENLNAIGLQVWVRNWRFNSVDRAVLLNSSTTSEQILACHTGLWCVVLASLFAACAKHCADTPQFVAKVLSTSGIARLAVLQISLAGTGRTGNKRQHPSPGTPQGSDMIC